ncbi:MAG: iron-siderophore ABC transporter substrate-binding protein [Nocardioides sp.]|uniref:ABC transporter substrate-binding protein n=1 Tax=Nocardioides sp. TaxID=35761 RepID=UPI0039E27276
MTRVALVGALLLLAPYALTGCGSEDTASASSGQTRTVTDVEGTTMEVPAHPTRIVTLSEPTLDAVLALGVTPVGTSAGRGQSGAGSYLGKKAAGIEIVGQVAAPDYEAIGKLKPDLILTDGTSINNNPDMLTVLRKIAPTFYTGYAGGDWRTNFGYVAAALNMTAEGKQVEQHYDDAVSAAKKKLTRYRQDTFSIVRWQGSSASLILEELPAGEALTDLGLSRPASQDRDGSGHSEPVSNENLTDIDADHMFFGTIGGSSETNRNAGGGTGVAAARKALAQAEKVPGFTDLTAYQNHQILLVDGSLWTSTGGPLLMEGIVASVVEALT